MTKETIKQNAEAYAKKHAMDMRDLGILKSTHIAGAHSRDEEIKELEKKVSALETVIVTARATTSTQEAIIKDLRNPWISVKDHLPKDGDIVLTRTVTIIEGGDARNESVQHLEQKYIGRWITNKMEQHRMGGILLDTIVKVTHWMPIPQAPENDN